nr:hypothetical protein [Okeania sp. SIO2F4]
MLAPKPQFWSRHGSSLGAGKSDINPDKLFPCFTNFDVAIATTE